MSLLPGRGKDQEVELERAPHPLAPGRPTHLREDSEQAQGQDRLSHPQGSSSGAEAQRHQITSLGSSEARRQASRDPSKPITRTNEHPCSCLLGPAVHPSAPSIRGGNVGGIMTVPIVWMRKLLFSLTHNL